MSEETQRYLYQFHNNINEWQHLIEKEAEEDHIPIMERDGIDFLKQLLRIKQPKRILEIGTAIGYSALQMIDAIPSAKMVTIERDPQRLERAKELFDQYDKRNRIELISGDAFDCIETVDEMGPYDVIFIDAAKGQYQRFFESFTPYLAEQGMVITDNILFHGYVANPSSTTKRLTLICIY